MKKLGVLGGMGPAATAEFLRLMTVYIPSPNDSGHPIVYVLSDPTTPDRSSAILGKGEDPSGRIRKNLETIASWGADFLAVPCNTAHYFIDRFTEPLQIKLVHIIEETIKATLAKTDRAWLVATLGTMNSGLYQTYADKMGLELLIPSRDLQNEGEAALRLVKAGKLEESGRKMKEIAEQLWAIDDVQIIGACTELPLAYDASGLPPEKMVSSLSALAHACVSYILAD